MGILKTKINYPYFVLLEQGNAMFVSDVDSKLLRNLLLFGSCDADVNVNKMIIEETISHRQNKTNLV